MRAQSRELPHRFTSLCFAAVVNPQGLISVAYNAPLPIGEVATAITTHSLR